MAKKYYTVRIEEKTKDAADKVADKEVRKFSDLVEYLLLAGIEHYKINGCLPPIPKVKK